MRRAWLIGGAALALLLVGYQQFNSGRAAGASKHVAPAGAPVRVGAVTQRDMAVVERSLGSVLANTSVQVLPLVSGTLEKQAFREGEFVQKGQLLFEIDPRPFRASLAQAQAIYQRDSAQLRNAVHDKQRFDTLFQQDSGSGQARDTAAANAEVLTATVAADKAAVDMARLNLDYATIHSPLTGKTGPVLIQPGNMVSGGAGNGVGSGSPLVVIAEVQPVKVSFSLPESYLPRIQARQRKGQLTATLDIRGREGELLSAPVIFTSNVITPQSGTIELRAIFPNTGLALVPGELVNVVVKLDDIPNALVVPRNAVNDSPNGPYAYAVKAGKAELKPVKVLFDNGTDVAVAGDLRPGDIVVTEGQLRVNAGDKVNVLGPSRPPSGPPPGQAGGSR
jgi:multidrug efflux system membrane fusion protein